MHDDTKCNRCPFCGSEPKFEIENHPLGYSVRVKCQNEFCDIAPATSFGVGDLKMMIEDSIMRWNKRACLD